MCSCSANDGGSIPRGSSFWLVIKAVDKAHLLISSSACCPFVLRLKGGDGLSEFSRSAKMRDITTNATWADAALKSSKKQTGEGQERKGRQPDATMKATTLKAMKRATSKVVKGTTLTKGRAAQGKQTEPVSKEKSMEEDVTMKEPIAAGDATSPARKARATARSVPLLMHCFGPNRSTKTLQQTYAQHMIPGGDGCSDL